MEQVRTNLPLQLTSFVGREQEVEALQEWLLSDRPSRLVTLTGPGGCGKSRLAQQVGAELLDEFPDGIFLAELATIADPAQIPNVLLSLFDLPVKEERSLLSQLSSYLRPRHLLLLLDNCEHLLDACATLTQDLLGDCPDLHILATSRQALGVPGERVWPVPTLRAPDPDKWPAEGDAVETLSKFPAVRLFVDRGKATLPTFSLSPANALPVAEICHRLDGLPLALELAAAWVDTLSPAQIAERLEERFTLLSDGNQMDLPRHRSLEAMLEWDYELLTVEERKLLNRLSVFSSSWSVEAAEAVGAGDGLSREQILPLLSQLVAKSLVVVEEREARKRYRLLETIRAYARRALAESGEQDAAEQRFLAYFRAFAEELGSGGKQADWKRARPEAENLQAALQLALAQERVEVAVDLLWYLHDSHEFIGHFGWNRFRYHHYASELLERFGSALSPALKARLLILASVKRHPTAEQLDRAHTYFRESLLIARREEHADEMAYERAEALEGLGAVSLWRGELEQAREYMEQALALHRELGRPHHEVLKWLGAILIELKEHEKAQQVLEESLRLCRKEQLTEGVAATLIILGELARAQDEHEEADRYYRQSATVARRIGQTGLLSIALFNRGLVALTEEALPKAQHAFMESLSLETAEPRSPRAPCLAGLAGLLSGLGQPLPAARLFSAAEAAQASKGMSWQPPDQVVFDRIRADIESALDETEFREAWEAGQKLALEEAIAEATALLEEEQPAVEDALASEPPPTRGAVESAVEESSPRERPPALCIRALGPTEVEREGRPLTPSDFTYHKAWELLFFLLVHPPRTREQIGVVLWPDASPSQLRSNLGVVLHHLRRALGSDVEWIIYESGTYTFNRNSDLTYQFDVETFKGHLQAAEDATGEEAIEHLRAAVALYRGDFVADLTDSEWAETERQALRTDYLDALMRLGRLLEGADRPREARDVYRQALATDSYLETAHRGLLRALHALGEPGGRCATTRNLSRCWRKSWACHPRPRHRRWRSRLRARHSRVAPNLTSLSGGFLRPRIRAG